MATTLDRPATQSAPTVSGSLAFPHATARPWVVREAIAPRIRQDGDDLWLESNGSEGCYGGWEIVLRRDSSWPDQLAFEIAAEATDLPRGTDALIVEAFWHDSADPAADEFDWAPLFLRDVTQSGNTLRARLGTDLPVPAKATELRVRCGIRWADRGRVRWHGWRLTPGTPRGEHRRLRLGVASAKPEKWISVEAQERHYLEQARRAGDAGIQLVCLPETVLTAGMPPSPDGAAAASRPIPGEWLGPWQALAREYQMGIAFSINERAGQHGETIYNTGVIIGRDGSYVGKYRKVHLALKESRKGIAAGHEFPTFDFHGATVGMAICMDSTPLESARTLARNGAEIMLMPIMGDFRATPWQYGRSPFDEEKWKAIQRAHALDNHLYCVTARNGTLGSAITAPWGEILAYDDGTRGVISADVDLDDVRAHHFGASIRSVIWSMRRPYTYQVLADTIAPTV